MQHPAHTHTPHWQQHPAAALTVRSKALTPLWQSGTVPAPQRTPLWQQLQDSDTTKQDARSKAWQQHPQASPAADPAAARCCQSGVCWYPSRVLLQGAMPGAAWRYWCESGACALERACWCTQMQHPCRGTLQRHQHPSKSARATVTAAPSSSKAQTPLSQQTAPCTGMPVKACARAPLWQQHPQAASASTSMPGPKGTHQSDSSTLQRHQHQTCSLK